MQSCPHCVDFKKMLQTEGIDFVDRDIEKNEEEYQIFVEVTQNDYVPAVLIIEEFLRTIQRRQLHLLLFMIGQSCIVSRVCRNKTTINCNVCMMKALATLPRSFHMLTPAKNK